jgi:hypothetical protein
MGVPLGITDIRLRLVVDSAPTDEQLAMRLKPTQHHCVVLQTLYTLPQLSATVQRSAA